MGGKEVVESQEVLANHVDRIMLTKLLYIIIYVILLLFLIIISVHIILLFGTALVL